MEKLSNSRKMANTDSHREVWLNSRFDLLFLGKTEDYILLKIPMHIVLSTQLSKLVTTKAKAKPTQMVCHSDYENNHFCL